MWAKLWAKMLLEASTTNKNNALAAFYGARGQHITSRRILSHEIAKRPENPMHTTRVNASLVSACRIVSPNSPPKLWVKLWAKRMALSVKFITAADKGVYQDGDGLMLKKTKKSAGYWVFRFTLDGKRRDFNVGKWPDMSLADARKARNSSRKLVDQGLNPADERKQQRLNRAGEPSLTETIYAAYEARKASLKSDGRAGRWLSPLELHIIPAIGHLPVTSIDQNLIRDALRPIWRDKNPTAKKAITRLKIALDHAVAQGWDVKTDSIHKAKILLGESGHIETHHAAMPWQELPAFYQTLGDGATVRRVLSFMLLTGGGARTAPVRMAKYDQIDGDVWTVPGALMKGREGRTADFRIPLSAQALELVELCRTLSDSEWIFAGPRGKPISDVMTSKFMRDHGIPYRPHGFRSSFRDWLAHIGTPFEIAETCIAHQVGSKVTRAYLRDDFLEKRRVIMAKWAAHLQGEGSAKILTIGE